MLIEKKIELLPRSLKLRLCSSRLKKSLTSVKSIPLNIHDLEKCIYLDMTYIFMSSGIFSKTITTHTTTKYFSIHEKKIKKTPLRNRSYPLSLYYFLLDKSNQKKIKKIHIDKCLILDWGNHSRHHSRAFCLLWLSCSEL